MTSWLIALFVFLGYALFPLYLLPSGLPQLSDGMLVIFIILTFIYILTSKTRITPLPLEWTLLVLVVVTVQLSWTAILQTLEIIHHLFFWLFNYLVCFCLYIFINKDPKKYLSIIYKAVSTALIISFIGVILTKDIGGRVTGFFNNPNQLAYFSLTSLVIVSYLKDFKLKGIFHVFILMIGVLAILFSASLGASISLGFLIISYLIKNLRFKRMIHFMIAVPLLVGMVIFLGGDRLVENINNRMARLDTKVENVESERNYDRILMHSELVFLGAGEGLYNRFNDKSVLEIHSSFGNLLFSYGLLSLILFSILLIRILVNLPLSYSISLFAPLTYSMTHMGLRSIYFWLLLTVCFFLCKRYFNKKQSFPSESKQVL